MFSIDDLCSCCKDVHTLCGTSERIVSESCPKLLEQIASIATLMGVSKGPESSRVHPYNLPFFS